MFRKVYEGEFGSPGGQPFGVLIGDYELQPRIGASGALHDDLDTLKLVANVAAAAFCPFIANASPAMFGVQEFVELQQTLDHIYQMKGWEKWQSLRNHDDARFVGLAMPRVLMRRPYRAPPSGWTDLCFQRMWARPISGTTCGGAQRLRWAQ